MDSVLVLNADFSTISLCSVERAFLLTYLQKADILSDNKEKALHSIDLVFPYPSVIRIKKYINIPYKGVVLTRHNIFKRDQYNCQYCGTDKNLTIDHLIPKSKGGQSTWTNLVTACQTCNSKKGDFTPEEVGLKLQKRPYKPSYIMFLRNNLQSIRTDWLPFL